MTRWRSVLGLGLGLMIAGACGSDDTPASSAASSAVSSTATGSGGATSSVSTSTATSGTGGAPDEGPTGIKQTSQSCDADADCESGSCRDGICCAETCDGTCVACRESMTGAPNGVCAPIIDGEDPDDECADGGWCDGDGACCGGRPTAPGGIACPAACTGGCNAGVCTIMCDDLEECRDQNLDCPPGFACLVRCIGDRACRKAIVHCPETYPCDVVCDPVLSSPSQQCREIEIRCTNGACSLTCNGGNDDQVCDRAELRCDTGACSCANSDPDDDPEIICNDACSCENDGCD